MNIEVIQKKGFNRIAKREKLKLDNVIDALVSSKEDFLKNIYMI